MGFISVWIFLIFKEFYYFNIERCVSYSNSHGAWDCDVIARFVKSLYVYCLNEWRPFKAAMQ